MCGQRDNHVVESRPGEDHVWRKRECRRCGWEFGTEERFQMGAP
jgi:transcriptional regulator NrdR family protein